MHSFIAVLLGTFRPANTTLSDDSRLLLVGQFSRLNTRKLQKLQLFFTQNEQLSVSAASQTIMNCKVMLTCYCHSANTANQSAHCDTLKNIVGHFGKEGFTFLLRVR